MMCAICMFDGRKLSDELEKRSDVIQHYEDQLSEATQDLRELREENKEIRLNWIRAKGALSEFLAWHETGARLDSLQLDRIRDVAADILSK